MDTYFHSVRLDKDKCRGCTNCIKRCPTQAIRVRNGKAVIIKERCIDCGECIRVCPHHAKYASRDVLSQIEDYKYKVALPAPALYGQFNNLDDINIILNALPSLGFDSVFEVSKAAELISEATRIYMQENTHIRPLISSACPAVVRLIRVCFPELVDNIMPITAPVDEAGRLARIKAVQKTGLKPEEIGVFFITPCPAKVTAIKQPIGIEKSHVNGALAINDIYPLLLKAMEKTEQSDELKALHESGVIGIGWATSGGEASGTLHDNALAADGIENCMKILEEVERGTLDAVDFIELNACQGGCVGGSLTSENPFIAKSRLMKLRKYSPISCNHLGNRVLPKELLCTSPVEPCDDVMKLADNVTEAMARMNRMKELLKVFPGLDCGTCGAPSCRALAEDVVRGFTTEQDCVFRAREELHEIDSDECLDRFIPAPFREIKEDCFMTVKELKEKLNLQYICNEGLAEEKNVTGCYCGDLLSWVMSRATEGDAWLTVMGNVTSIGVAVLADVACIILTENAPADADAIKRAEENEVIILGTDKNSYQIAVEISKLI